MKIGLLGPANSSHLMKLANGFVGSGHEVLIVSIHEPCEGYRESVRHKKLFMPAPWGYVLCWFQLMRVFEAEKLDIINVHYLSGYGTLARLANVKRAVLSVWGSDVLVFPNRTKFHYLWTKYLLRYFSGLLSTSHSMARAVREDFSVSSIDVIPFGVDTNAFNNSGSKPTDTINIVAVKSLKKVYSLNKTIIAFKTLLDKYDVENFNVKLIIAGQGPEFDSLQRLIKNLEIGDHVEMIGKIEHSEVPELLANCHVGCYLSTSESFGVSVLEAMSSGIPCICSDTLGFTELLEHGVNGYIVKDGDPEQVAKYLYSLCVDEQKRIQLGGYGRKYVLENYDFAITVSKYIHNYNSFLGKQT